MYTFLLKKCETEKEQVKEYILKWINNVGYTNRPVGNSVVERIDIYIMLYS